MSRYVNIQKELVEFVAVRIAEGREFKAGDTVRWLGRSAYSDEDTIQREATLSASDLEAAKKLDLR